MKLMIVGGKLQGTEAVYLAAKAGYETVLVDRRERIPAAGLADRCVFADITADEALTRRLVRSCDAVLPACENEPTLAWLARRVPRWGVPFLFDLDAYHVTEAKLASRRLFAANGVPRPLVWPACGFPAIVKPDVASGSEGVALAHDEAELEVACSQLRTAGHRAVVEEYVEGPSLSLEVLAWGGRAVPLQATGLEFDAAWDCKRVVAPVDAASAAGPTAVGCGTVRGRALAAGRAALACLDEVGVRLAEGLGLNGLMDVEVIAGGAGTKVLEIDARLPSQTPTAVLWSSGLNIVELLVETSRRGELPHVVRVPSRACVYQHVRAQRGVLEVIGEHAVGRAGPLALVPDFFGADEALTDYRPRAATWVATLITTASSVSEAREKASRVVQEAAKRENLHLLPEADASPCTETRDAGARRRA